MINSNNIARSVLMLLLFCQLLLNGQTKNEIFPLKKNLHYSYDYYSKDLFRDMTISWPVATDSGSIEYVVIDSVNSNDSSTSWTLREIKHLYHWRMIPKDTNYITHDTVTLNLIEYTSGPHNLNVDGFLWKYPFTDPRQEVFRYDPSHTKELLHNWSTGATTGSDSIQLNDSVGLFYSSSRYYSGTPSNGSSGFSIAKLRTPPVTTVNYHAKAQTNFLLNQNYPNPFNPTTNITYQLTKRSFVNVKIYDLLGRDIETLYDSFQVEGSHTLIWNAVNYSSGVYYCKVSSEYGSKTIKLVLMR